MNYSEFKEVEQFNKIIQEIHLNPNRTWTKDRLNREGGRGKKCIICGGAAWGSTTHRCRNCVKIKYAILKRLK